MNVAPPIDAAAMTEWRVTTDASETDTGAFLKVRSTTALPTAPTFFDRRDAKRRTHAN